MHITGIIAEYNPFHNGHNYHLETAKKLSGADYVIVVMSPDFVQRGEPSIFDKYIRTEMALLSGVDLVLELPVCYATGSAEYFAEGGVSLLDSLGVVDTLCFGGESEDLSLFLYLAGTLHNETDDFKSRLQSCLKQGLTFPQARCAALEETQDIIPDASLQSFLSSPNNILGTEYCRAILKTDSSIRPLPVLRKGSSFCSTDLTGRFCSATALRKGILEDEKRNNLLDHIPKCCHSLFKKGCENIMPTEKLLPFLWQKLLSDTDFDSVFDITPDLSRRIRNLRYSCIGKSWEETVSLLKTRQYTQARIRRALIHLILDITSDSVNEFRKNGTVFYARVLGFSKNASPLLRQIREKSRIPLITKPSLGKKLTGPAAKMWQQDMYASHLYRSVLSCCQHEPFLTEYEISPVIIPSPASYSSHRSGIIST